MRLPFRRKGGTPNGPMYQIVEVIGSSAQGLDEAVEAAAERLAERRRTKRGWPSIDLIGLALLGAAAAGAYAAVRGLLDRDASELPVPEPLEQAAADLAGELRQAREAVKAGIVEARRATAEAMRDLEADFLERTGRGPAAAPQAPSPEAVLRSRVREDDG
jgi:hypothetical protein